MSLSTAFASMRSSLTASGGQAEVISRNIAGASTPGFARKTTLLATSEEGGVDVTGIARAANASLLAASLDANARSAAQSAQVDALNAIATLVDAGSGSTSPAVLMGKLNDSLTGAAGAPSNTLLAADAVTAAGDLAASLRKATASVQSLRGAADAQMSDSVTTINNLLAKFGSLNTQIVNGTAAGADITGTLDARDEVLSQLSGQIGITTQTRDNNDIVIHTDSGVVMYDGAARNVRLQTTPNLTASTTGQPVTIDGVPVTGGGPMATSSGRIAGLAAVRDAIAPQFQAGLDETARGLIATFAESDQSASPTKPDAAGLFTWPGAPSIPGSPAIKGLAGKIVINPNVDPAQGGRITLLRDGGITDPTDPAYDYNAAGVAGFAGRLQQLTDKLSAPQTLTDPTGTSISTSLPEQAAAVAGSVQAQRQGATARADYLTTLVTRTSQALANDTGANLDDEMSKMLDVEHSFQATAKLMSTIDSMFTTLFDAVR